MSHSCWLLPLNCGKCLECVHYDNSLENPSKNVCYKSSSFFNSE